MTVDLNNTKLQLFKRKLRLINNQLEDNKFISHTEKQKARDFFETYIIGDHQVVCETIRKHMEEYYNIPEECSKYLDLEKIIEEQIKNASIYKIGDLYFSCPC